MCIRVYAYTRRCVYVFVYRYLPTNRPSVFAFFFAFGLFRGWGGGGGVGLLTSLVFVLHDLRSDRLFYFVARTSCYVDYFGVGGSGY